MANARRLVLHQLLVDAAGEGVRVYFQPPSTDRMQYPCIRYERSTSKTTFAGNKPYHSDMRYTVTVMDEDNESKIHERVALLPQCSHSTSFVADTINHDVYDIYI